MGKMTPIQQFYNRLSEIEVYARCEGKLSFDMMCCAPPEGMERAGEDQAFIAQRILKLTHAPKYTSLLNELHNHPQSLNPLQKRAVESRFEMYEKRKNINPKLAGEIVRIQNQAYASWLEAKEKNDYSIFRDSLENIISITRLVIEKLDKKPATWYDACLEDYEKGSSIDKLDSFFGALQQRITPLLTRIVREGKPIRDDFLSRSVPLYKQEAFSRMLLETEGLRMSATALMTTEHPFTSGFGLKDVRVTTHYYENMFFSNVYTTLHEGGHAIFDQNEPLAFEQNHISGLMTNAMHECISRFYENIIGRSEAFIHYIYPKLCALVPELMEGVSERELYEAVNIARPSLIRTEADELRYCLHILVRYEMEKGMVNGTISVDEVPAVWRDKYQEYLGIEVPDDRSGCLQDVHWCDGFGYFPSYALGNAYGAQILRTMEKDMDVWSYVEKGELYPIRDWLKEKVFSKASMMDPEEWILSITGEGLNPDYYLSYLEDKYTKLYGLK